MRIGTMLSMPGDPSGTRALVERAAAAEQAGFASVWLPQVATVDALMVLALAGAQTRRIELGTAVVPTYPRHPTALAMQALTVQDATQNRLALGIGLSHRFMIEDSLGLDYSKPIPHMRDYLNDPDWLAEGRTGKARGGNVSRQRSSRRGGRQAAPGARGGARTRHAAPVRPSRRRHDHVDGWNQLPARGRNPDDERRRARGGTPGATLRRDGAGHACANDRGRPRRGQRRIQAIWPDSVVPRDARPRRRGACRPTSPSSAPLPRSKPACRRMRTSGSPTSSRRCPRHPRRPPTRQWKYSARWRSAAEALLARQRDRQPR